MVPKIWQFHEKVTSVAIETPWGTVRHYYFLKIFSYFCFYWSLTTFWKVQTKLVNFTKFGPVYCAWTLMVMESSVSTNLHLCDCKCLISQGSPTPFSMLAILIVRMSTDGYRISNADGEYLVAWASLNSLDLCWHGLSLGA